MAVVKLKSALRLFSSSSSIPSYFPSSTVCIVGSGPSGLYSAKYLLKDDAGVRVDVIDYLPSPFGESIQRLVAK